MKNCPAKTIGEKPSLQSLLIKYVLDPLSLIMDGVGERARSFIFILSGVFIFCMYFLRGGELLDTRYLVYFALCCLFFGIMLLSTMKKNMKPIHFRPVLFIPWIAVGFTMLYSGIFNSVDFLPEAVLFLIAYPIAYIVWNNNDGSYILSLISSVVEYSFIVYIVVSITLFPMNSLRYSGIFSNTNAASGYLGMVFAFTLVELMQSEKINARAVRHIILSGLSASLVMYTNSRTGQIEILVAIIVCIGIKLYDCIKNNRLVVLRNILILVLSTVILFFSSIFIFQIGNYINFREMLGLDFDEFSGHVITPGESLELSEDRLGSEDSGISEYSSGRVDIWREYFKKLNFKGHPDSGKVTFYYDGETKEYHTAHMTPLQFAYENGILSGVFYLIFNISAGICSLIYAVRNPSKKYALLPLIVAISYGVNSMLGNTNISFWYIAAFCYYLVQFPVMKVQST